MGERTCGPAAKGWKIKNRHCRHREIRRMDGEDRAGNERRTTVTNPWLAAALGMGHPSRVCNLVSAFKI